jgi:hypothetical protein
VNSHTYGKIRHSSLLMVGMALLCQCQTGSAGRWVTLHPTDRVVVSYQRGQDGGLRQTLVAGAGVSPRQAYSPKDADPGLKVAQLDQVQDLLNQFGRHRFFQKAHPSAPANAKQTISVEVNGQSQVLTMLPAHVQRSREDLVDFIACKAAFVSTFNQTQGFSSGRTSAAELQQSQAELRERAQRLQEQRRQSGQSSKSGKQ